MRRNRYFLIQDLKGKARLGSGAFCKRLFKGRGDLVEMKSIIITDYWYLLSTPLMSMISRDSRCIARFIPLPRINPLDTFSSEFIMFNNPFLKPTTDLSG